MDGIGMVLVNFPTGPLVEVQVNWSSSGELRVCMFFVSSLRFNEFQKLSFTIMYIFGVYSGSGHGTTAARDRGAFFFWPTSGLHIIVSHSRLCSVNGEFPSGYKYTTGPWTPLLLPIPLSLILFATGSFSPTHCLPRTLVLKLRFRTPKFFTTPLIISKTHTHHVDQLD